MKDQPKSDQPKSDPDGQNEEEPKYSAATERDIEKAMKRHGLTRKEVLEML